jgi:hypothetical protein
MNAQQEVDLLTPAVHHLLEAQRDAIFAEVHGRLGRAIRDEVEWQILKAVEPRVIFATLAVVDEWMHKHTCHDAVALFVSARAAYPNVNLDSPA